MRVSIRSPALAVLLTVAVAGCNAVGDTAATSKGSTSAGKAASQPMNPTAGRAAAPAQAGPKPTMMQPMITANPTAKPMMAPPAAEAKTLFVRACGPCHGLDGTGDQIRAMLPKVGNLTSAELHGRMSDADIEALMMTGRGKMPPFAGALTSDQAKLIIGYVRTLKR